jgi:hypothetical protein
MSFKEYTVNKAKHAFSIRNVGLFSAIAVALLACGEEATVTSTPALPAGTNQSVAAPAANPGLGIRPVAEETVSINMDEIHSEELKEIFAYIDENIDEHVLNLRRWIQQPSISNTGEGIQ